MEMKCEDWGIIDYTKALERQQEAVKAVIAGEKGRLIFCEHPPVLTLGRLFKQKNLLYTPQELKNKGVQIYSVDRGGDITLHAPGQLVIYPIINLNHYGRDLKAYLDKLEQVAVDLLKDFGILAMGISGKRGVFVGQDKIISIGIGVRKWASYHGVGINVNTDLSLFSLIRPCGLDVQMTSMAKLLSKPVDMPEVKANWIKNFNNVFKVDILK